MPVPILFQKTEYSGFIQVSLDKNEQSDLCEKLNNIIAGSVIEFEGKMVKSEYVNKTS